jgi:hypothetical protein
VLRNAFLITLVYKGFVAQHFLALSNTWRMLTHYTPVQNFLMIRAKSMYYNELAFSDVSINMSEEESEDYNTDEGACFGKVYYINSNFTFI